MSMMSDLKEYLEELEGEIEDVDDVTIRENLKEAYAKVETKFSDVTHTIDYMNDEMYKLVRR